MPRGRTLTTVALVAVLGACAACGTAYGVVRWTERHVTTTGAPSNEPPSRSTSPSPSPVAPTVPAPPSASASPVETPSAAPRPEPLMAPGDRGRQVRELQARLAQLAWFTPPTTRAFDATTQASVAGFQARRGLPRSGSVDARTWRRLVAMTRTPTGDELYNRAGPALFAQGDHGRQVREIQARLRQIAWFSGDVSDVYGAQTRAAVAGFQAKRGIPQTGAVDRRTLTLLEAMTTEPTADELANRAPDPAAGAALDQRCTTGRALCIDKTSSSLRWVVDGHVLTTLDVRFGASYTPTREGLFHVYWKDRDHVSSLYGSAMPFSMFFSGGEAVHYSSDFAARGYAGASHGCVNVRDYTALAALFDQVRVGDKVVVYWS